MGVASILHGVVREDLLEVVSEEERKETAWTSGERASGTERGPKKKPPGRSAWSARGTAGAPCGWSTVTKERGLDHVGPAWALNRLWSHGRLYQRSDMLQIRLEKPYGGGFVTICANGGHR